MAEISKDATWSERVTRLAVMGHIETNAHGLDVAPTRHGRKAQSRSMLWSKIIGNGVYSSSEYSRLRPPNAPQWKLSTLVHDIEKIGNYATG